MSKTILGLDIRVDGVSAVLLKSGLKGPRVSAFAAAALPQADDPAQALGHALAAIGEKLDFAGSDCIAGLPDQLVSYRYITLPFTDERKIRQVLPFELEASLPFPVDQAVLDFYRVHTADQTRLLAGVLHSGQLGESLAALAAAGLAPEAVGVGGFAVARCLAERAGADGHLLLIDIGAGQGQVTVLMAGKIHLIYPFSIGASLTADGIGSHVGRALAALEGLGPEDCRPVRALLTGVAAADPVLQAEIAAVLEIPVEALDLGRPMAGLLPEAGGDGWQPCRFDRALALALAGTGGKAVLNFRRGAFAPRRKWAEHRTTLIRLGALALAVLLLGAAQLGLEVYFMNQRRSALDAEIAAVFQSAFPEVTRIVDPLQQMRVKLADLKKTLFLPGDGGDALLNIDILYALSTLIPAETDVELNQLLIGPESVLISGNTDTFNTVDDIKNRLERQAGFKAVTISSATMEKTDNRVRFKLKVQL
jgi:general secretion pathway protein L